MEKYYGSKAKSINGNQSSLFWFIISFVLLFLFIAPFYKALFNGGGAAFDRPIYTAVIWSAVILFLLSIYLWSHWRNLGQRVLLSMMIWLIPLSFLISSFHAASYDSAIKGDYISILFATFFMIGLVLTRNRQGSFILLYGVVVSGYLLVIYGLMNWLGNANYQDAILAGNRLSNVFQYPNTYAAYLVGIFLSALHLAQTSKNKFLVLGHGFMLAPIFVSILLTLSRGGMLIFPVVLLLYFLFSPWTRQLIALIIVAISGAASLLLFNPLVGIRTQLAKQFVTAASLKGWGLLIVVSVVVGIVVFLLERYAALRLYSKFPQPKRFSCLVIPVALVVVAVLFSYLLLATSVITDMLPPGIKQRIAELNTDNISVLARGTFYKDATLIFKDYPVVGAGAGAWSNLYETYKSYAYISRQAHNFFLQYLVETGIVGFVILLGLIGYVFYLFTRNYLRRENESDGIVPLSFMLMTVSLLGHSIIDFDMSFVYVAALVFLSLGAMAFLPEAVKTSTPTADPSNTHRWLRWVSLAAAALSLFIFIVSAMSLSAGLSYAAALTTPKDFNAMSRNVDKALSLQPHNPDYQLLKINLFRQAYQQTKDDKFYREAQDRIEQLKLTDSFNRNNVDAEYSLSLLKQDLPRALSVVSSAINKFPWDINLHERIIVLNYELGAQARNAGPQEAEKYWGKALDAYQAVERKRKDLDQLPAAQKAESNGFKITPKMALSAGQIYYMREDYSKAASVLSIGRVSDDFKDPVNRMVARWYLASLQQQKRNDEKLLALLLKADPQESQNMQSIIDRKF